MPEYDNNMTGVLFKNKKKQPGDKQPDYKGNCEVEGKRWDVAGWIRTNSKDDSKFMSLKFSALYKKEGGAEL